jgi:hypothetical protein
MDTAPASISQYHVSRFARSQVATEAFASYPEAGFPSAIEARSGNAVSATSATPIAPIAPARSSGRAGGDCALGRPADRPRAAAAAAAAMTTTKTSTAASCCGTYGVP